MLFLFILISTLTNIREINWVFLQPHEQEGLFLQPRKQYIIWHTTISQQDCPSLIIKRHEKSNANQGDKCYSLMLLCLKINCINLRSKRRKSLPSSRKTTQNFFPNISARHFSNVCNLLSCYHNSRILIYRYQRVILRNNDMLF